MENKLGKKGNTKWKINTVDYLCSSKIIQVFFFFALLIKDNAGPAEMHQQAKDNCGNLLTFSTLNCPCIIGKGMRHYEEENF